MKTTIFLALTLLMVSCGKKNNNSSNTNFSLSAMQSNGVTIELVNGGYGYGYGYGQGAGGIAIVRCVGSMSYGYGYGYGNTTGMVTNQQRLQYLQSMMNIGGVDVNGGRIGPQTLNQLVQQASMMLSYGGQFGSCQNGQVIAQVQNTGY